MLQTVQYRKTDRVTEKGLWGGEGAERLIWTNLQNAISGVDCGAAAVWHAVL